MKLNQGNAYFRMHIKRYKSQDDRYRVAICKSNSILKLETHTTVCHTGVRSLDRRNLLQNCFRNNPEYITAVLAPFGSCFRNVRGGTKE